MQTQRDTARIDQLAVAGNAFSAAAAWSWGKRNTVSSQPRCKLCVDLAFGDEQRGAFCVEQV